MPEPAVVAVASGKGGVGKSTIALNVAVAMAADGASVGLLDADLYGPDLPVMVGLTRRQHTSSLAVWKNPTIGERREPAVERFGIKLMSTQFLVGEDQPLALTTPLAELLVERMRHGIDWGPLDVLLVDLPPGTADIQQLVARHLSPRGALVVVTPQDVAHLDAKKTIAMYRASRVPIIGGIENMAGLQCPTCNDLIEVFPAVAPERSIWADGIERLAAVPMSPAVARAAENGTPAVLADTDGAAASAFRDLARVLQQWLR